MTDTIIQLTLWPLDWWHNPDLWRIRKHVSSVKRPTEDRALDNLFYESRALQRRDFVPGLTDFERRVYDLDMQARRTLPHYHTEHERAMWIAEQLRVVGAWQVKAILNDISYVVREQERLNHVRMPGALRVLEKAALPVAG